MENILITGVAGFVGGHMLSFLSKKPGLKILGIDRQKDFHHPSKNNLDLEYHSVDLNNREVSGKLIENFKPDAIIHLAALSSVGNSWKHPLDSFRNNTNIFLSVLNAVRASGLNCRILSIGSSEEYGTIAETEMPLNEYSDLKPANPYAVSSISKYFLANTYVKGYGLDIVMTRSFNQMGPGQSTDFFIPSIASQLSGEKGKSLVPVKLQVGDLSIIRDYTDVRDVVKAYWDLLIHGKKGEVYNVCSGTGWKLKEIVHLMIDICGKEVELEVEKSRIRPVDNPVIIGSNKKIYDETGWTAKISMERSLKDILDYS